MSRPSRVPARGAPAAGAEPPTGVLSTSAAGPSPRRSRVMTALTLVIVLLSASAFVWTQMLKQEDAPVGGIEIDRELRPGCECSREVAKLSFVLERAQPVTATVVDEDGAPVRVLLDGALRAGGRETLTWDGTDAAGRPAPDGDYRLELDLATPDRTIEIPSDVALER